MNTKDAGYADINAGKIAVFMDTAGTSYSEAVVAKLKKSGYNIEIFDYDTAPSEIFVREKFDLVLLCGAEAVPTGTISAIDNYMNNKGKILTLGGAAFDTVLYKNDNGWVDKIEYLAAYADKTGGKTPLIDFTVDRIEKTLSRSTNDTKNKQNREIGDFGRGNKTTLCVTVENLTGWDLIATSCEVPAENNAIAFWAKGDAYTSSLYIEFSEKDGSRWYTNVHLTEKWQYFIVPESKFLIWDSPARNGTSFNLSEATSTSIGFAMSGMSISSGEHTFYLDDFSSIINTFKELETEENIVVDGLLPTYEQYPITNAAKISANNNQLYVKDAEYVLPSELYSCHPGRMATGYGNNRVSRFIPLLEVTDEKGLHSGYLAWLYRFTSTTVINGKREGSAAGVISTGDPAFYNEAGLAVVTGAVQALLADSYIVQGGSDEFIYIKSDKPDIKFGMSAAIADEENAELRVTLYNGDNEVIVLSEKAAEAKDNSTFRKCGYYTEYSSYNIANGEVDHVKAELYVEGKLVDYIEHDIVIWSPKPVAERKYIYTENNSFMQDGKRINLFGVNYMPSYGIAEPNGSLFEYYISQESYDPDVVYRDLMHIKDIGMNAVSVFVYYSTVINSNNMLHLINLCDSLGIYVDLSIRPNVYPMEFIAKEVEVLIRKCHFDEVDNIVAYDIAWEKGIGNYDVIRAGWDSAWTEWIKDQYGTVDAAVDAWDYNKFINDTAGNIIVTDDMLNGKISGCEIAVAAYRRFIDDYVSSAFSDKVEYMREIDPNHLISFRMANAGSAVDTSWSGYDFQSLASSLDFMSPEGYALRANEDSCFQVPFTASYARYVKPDAPVVLKEYGQHVWNGTNFGNNTTNLEAQELYYKHVLDKEYKSYVSALYCWFFAGGFRVNENSDYGIINPDGSDRPATVLLREYAEKFKNQGDIGEAEAIITVERDDFADGVTGMYTELKDDIIAAVGAGQHIEFVDKNNGGYADEVSDIAIGGYKLTNGELAPLKYVNGQIVRADVTVDGSSVRVIQGDMLPDGGTLILKITNTGHSAWRADTVSIISEGDVTVDTVIHEDVPYLGTITVETSYTGSGNFKLYFNIDGRCFGYGF